MPDLTELQRLAEVHYYRAASMPINPDTAKKLIAVARAAQASVRAWDVFEATEVGHFNEQIMLTCEAADKALRTALEQLK